MSTILKAAPKFNAMQLARYGVNTITIPSKYNLVLLCFIIFQTWCKANTWHFSLIKTISWTHNSKYCFYYRGLEEDVFQCAVQLCGFLSLDLVQEGQLIGRQEWTHLDAERPKELPVRGAHAFTSSGSGSDTESIEGSIDSDSDYYLESTMDTDVVSDVDNC